MPFAMTFMKVALATLLASSRVELEQSASYVQDFFFGVMIPKGLRASFRPR